MNSFRLTTVKNTMIIYVNSFRLCQSYFPVESQELYLSKTSFVTVQCSKNNGKKPISQLCFLLIIYLRMQLFVCSVYITNTGPRRERSYNPTAR